ncbi:MAG: hypothetical protein RMI34_07720 [Chloroherpetonaceae bacterium]|nr:hypothetical protein [Chloroherpetonaceae bacterium]MDW8019947.1 hypothetical protein [Chloroherpetonaceae bacterium]
MKRIFSFALGLFFLFALQVGQSQAQERQLTVTTSPAKEGEPFEIRIGPPQDLSISRAVARIRIYGTSDYRVVEAQPEGNVFVVRIPGDEVEPPAIEFYVVAQMVDGSRLTYPAISPETTPASVTVTPKPEDPRLILISPERNAVVSEDELIISFSFYRISDQVDRSKIQLFYDGVDVTQRAVISENMITYVPDRPRPGRSRAAVVVRNAEGVVIATNTVVFTVLSRTEVGVPQLSEAEKRKVRFTSQNAAELRSERINDSTINYARLNLSFDATLNFVEVGAQVYVTNENQAFRQPANRFLGRLSIPFLEVKAGDVFPEYTYYLSNGVRVRGVEVTATPGPIRATVLVGNAAEAVEAQFIGGRVTIPVTPSPGRLDSINALLQRGFVRIDSSAAGETFQQRTAVGAFARNMFAAVAGFNTPFVRFNLQVLRGSDDITGLNRLQILSRGVAPQQNVAIGGSMKVIPVAGLAEIFADFGFSLTNRDITDGSLSPRELDQLTGNVGLANRLQLIPIIGSYDNLTRIITINKNLTPLLPIDLSSLAFRAGGELTIREIGNTLRAEYLRQGAQFNSFGLAFYLPDVQGFRVSDRLRIWDNRILLSAAFESLSDNLLRQRDRVLRTGGTLDATTTRSLFRFGGAYFPTDDWPNIRLEFQLQNNKNNIPATFRDSVGAGATARLENISGLALQNDNSTITVVADLQKTFVIKEQPLLNSVTAGLTAIVSNRRDNRDLTLRSGVLYSPADSEQVSQDFSSRSITLSGIFAFSIPLRLNVNVTNQLSEFFVSDMVQVGGTMRRGAALRSQAFTSIDISAGYGFVNNTLRPTARLNLIFGNFPRAQIGLNVLYDVTQSIQVSGDVAAFFVQAANVNGVAVRQTTDLIAALRVQAVFGN